MKILIALFGALIIALAWLGCSGSGGEDVIVTGTDTPPEKEGTPTKEIQAALTNGMTMKFYDGETIWVYSDASTRAAPASYTDKNVLYNLDKFGDELSSKNLVTSPDGICLDGENIWIVERISPEEAMAAGALPKDYTKIYLNASEYGDWMTRQWYTDKLVIHNTDIYTRINTGAWKCIAGGKDKIRIVVENGFAIYDYDSVNRTAKIDGVDVTWKTNFLNGANYWLKSGATWYSQNGYSWDGITLVENDLAMADWRPVQNVIISAGSRFENGEDVLYFVDCSTGHTLRYVPSVDQYTVFVRLYTGDGETETGLYHKPRLNPSIIGDDLFFWYDANEYRYNFITGLTSHFTTGVNMVLPY